MRKNLFKIVLPIFLFGVLFTTLYFTLGNKNQIERVMAQSVIGDGDGGGGTTCRQVSCSRDVYTCNAPAYYIGTCQCTHTNGYSKDVSVPWGTHLTNSDCNAYCKTQYCEAAGSNCTGGSGQLTYGCIGSGTYNGANCSYTVYENDCGSSHYSVTNKNTETNTYSSCPTGWTQDSVIVAGCTGVPTCNSLTYNGNEQTFTLSGDATRLSFTPRKETTADSYDLTVSPKSNYRWCSGCGSGAETITCIMNKKSVAVTWSGASPSASSGITGQTIKLATVSWTKSGGGTGTGTPTAPGTYTLTTSCSSVTGGSCNNYSLTNTSRTYTVEDDTQIADDVSDALCKDNLVYNGSTQQLTTVTEGNGYTLSNYTGKASDEYKVTAKLKSGYKWSDGTTADKDFYCVIYQKYIAKPTASEYCLGGLEYNGTDQTVVKAPGTGFTWLEDKAKNAGKVEITAIVDDDYQFNDESYEYGSDIAEFECEIAPRAITVKASDQTKVYDGTPLTADNTCEVISGSLLSGHTITCSCSGTQTEIGSSDKICESITFTGVNPDNYIATGQKGALTVTADEAHTVTITWKNFSFPYDGNQHSPTPTATVDGKTMLFTREYKKGGTSLGATAPKEVGDYSVTVTCKDGNGITCSEYTITNPTANYSIIAKPATSVTLNKTGTQWLIRGRTMALTATVEPADSTDTVTWSSSDSTIASVSSNGTVKGEKVGTATITATAGDKTASVIIKVYVQSSEVHVTGVTLNKTTDEVEVGRTISLVATVSPDTATNKGVTWTTSDSTIATVSGGVVTGVKEGTATITVKTDDQGKTASATITVKKATTPVVNVTGVTLNPTSGTISTGETFVLEATVEPENASNKNVTWTSSNPLVATVSDSGVVTGISAGTATITVKTVDKNKTATATVTVEGQSITVGKIDFEADSYTCEAGNSFNTTITYTGVLGGVRPTVTSSNNSIAEISIMTPKVCSGTSTTRCVGLTPNEINECGASGDGVQPNCVSLLHKYTALVKCKATGTATLTASLSDSIIANASLTVNEQGSDYSITFDGNEGSLKYDGEMNDSLVIKGVGTTTIADALAEVVVIREGYTFDGWYTGLEDGTKVEDTAEFGSLGVTTLYAHWTLISGTRFTLKFNSNGGTACSPSSITVDAGEEWGTLCTPTRKGYAFNGWFTAKNGGVRVTGNDVATKNLTVYAQWIVNPKTGISTPVIALLVVALVSIVAFLVIRKKKATTFE